MLTACGNLMAKPANLDKKDSGICPGFSNRFNYFLDKAGYPNLNSGRLTVFSEDLNTSVSGARKWIVEDSPPKTTKLIEVCEKIADEKLTKRFNARKIACWLEYGEEIVPNPFNNKKSIANDHVIMGNIYVLVHKEAKKLNIDIYRMDPKLVNEIYDQLMEEVVRNNLADPDKRFISSLLVLSDKKQNNKK